MSGAVISTHPLTWCVTIEEVTYNLEGVNFNSHAHVERDYFSPSTSPALKNFNSHAHVERDT